MKLFVGEASFASLPTTLRDQLDAVPTRLKLPEAQVDMVIEAGRQATRGTPEFNGFLASLDRQRRRHPHPGRHRRRRPPRDARQLIGRNQACPTRHPTSATAPPAPFPPFIFAQISPPEALPEPLCVLHAKRRDKSHARQRSIRQPSQPARRLEERPQCPCVASSPKGSSPTRHHRDRRHMTNPFTRAHPTCPRPRPA